MFKNHFIQLFWVLVCLSLVAPSAHASDVSIAVASNFMPVMLEVKKAYKSLTGKTLSLSSASTGKLYAQIKNGAPYDVFLSADADRPELLVKEGIERVK